MESNPQWTPSCPICETFVAGIYRLYEKENHKKPKEKWIAREPASSAEIDEDGISWTFEFRDSAGFLQFLMTERCLWCCVLKSVWGKFKYTDLDILMLTRTINVNFCCTRNRNIEGVLGNIVSLKPEGDGGLATVHIRDERSHQY